MRSQRGPFILRTSPRQSQLRRAFPKLAPAFERLPSFVAIQLPGRSLDILNPTVGSLPNKKASQRQGGRHSAGHNPPVALCSEFGRTQSREIDKLLTRDEAGASQQSLAATSPRFQRKNYERCDFSATRKSPIFCDTFRVDSLTNGDQPLGRDGGCVVTGMRSRVRNEVCPGVVGLLVLAAALAIPSDGADARYHLQASQDAQHSAHAEGYSPPSSSIVVDGNTGKVLQESNRTRRATRLR